jgi:hypothetical protein
MTTLLDSGRPAGQQVAGIRRPHARPAQVRAVIEQHRVKDRRLVLLRSDPATAPHGGGCW